MEVEGIAIAEVERRLVYNVHQCDFSICEPKEVRQIAKICGLLTRNGQMIDGIGVNSVHAIPRNCSACILA